MTAMP
jgi:hypothetical protein